MHGDRSGGGLGYTVYNIAAALDVHTRSCQTNLNNLFYYVHEGDGGGGGGY